MSDDFGAITMEMMDELETDPIFLPSVLWRDINNKNADMIKNDGIENLKRTLSQNYFNWMVVRLWDPQFLRAMWDWLCHPSLRPLRTTIERDVNIWQWMRDRPQVFSARQKLIYRLFVGCLWETMRRTDRFGLSAKVAEPEVGNPIHVRQDGKLITQDLANSIIECNIIAGLLSQAGPRPRVAEIGAGYGRLAHVYAATQPGTYFIFDIPPALFVSQWYLSRALPDKKMFRFRRFGDFENVREEIEQADIVFLTANQIRKFPPGYFDVMLSISTLPEMRGDQVSLYLELFQKLSARHIYLKQWKSWRNDQDDIHIQRDNYIFGDNWKTVLDMTDPVNPKFFNSVWQRS